MAPVYHGVVHFSPFGDFVGLLVSTPEEGDFDQVVVEEPQSMTDGALMTCLLGTFPSNDNTHPVRG